MTTQTTETTLEAAVLAIAALKVENAGLKQDVENRLSKAISERDAKHRNDHFCMHHTDSERTQVQSICLVCSHKRGNALEEKLDEARAVLKELEWIFDAGPGNPVCPSCEGWKKDGHKSDCKLAKVLSA